MVIIKMKDTCEISSKPKCCDKCPFWEVEREFDMYGEFEGTYICTCKFGNSWYRRESDGTYYKNGDISCGNHVIADECPIISIEEEA